MRKSNCADDFRVIAPAAIPASTASTRIVVPLDDGLVGVVVEPSVVGGADRRHPVLAVGPPT